jgi:hypothetical protein
LCIVFEASWTAWRVSFFGGAPLQGVVCKALPQKTKVKQCCRVGRLGAAALLSGMGRRLMPVTPPLQEGVANKEIELELIQAHMTRKPLLWVEASAHAVRKRPTRLVV